MPRVFVNASSLIVLSGDAALVEKMSLLVAFISRADPVRYMLIAVRGLFLQDMPLEVVSQQAWPTALVALPMLVIAGLAVRRAIA